ncbi:MAG: cupredoxin domain-containing protein [Solirubrobacterales bacterium]
MTTSLPRPRRSVLTLGLGLALCLLLLPSGGSSAGASATASAAKRVSIVNFAFKPGTLRVDRGGAVAFANTANTTHTASSGSFDTKRIAPGKSVTVKFNKRGTFAYHCKIHPFMKGKVLVE